MSFAVKKSQACSSNCGKTGSERFQGRSLQGSWQFMSETWAVAMVNLPSKAVLEFKQMPTSWGNDHILSLKVVSYLHLFPKAPETSDAMSKLYQTVLKCFFVRHQIRGKEPADVKPCVCFFDPMRGIIALCENVSWRQVQAFSTPTAEAICLATLSRRWIFVKSKESQGVGEIWWVGNARAVPPRDGKDQSAKHR